MHSQVIIQSLLPIFIWSILLSVFIMFLPVQSMTSVLAIQYAKYIAYTRIQTLRVIKMGSNIWVWGQGKVTYACNLKLTKSLGKFNAFMGKPKQKRKELETFLKLFKLQSLHLSYLIGGVTHHEWFVVVPPENQGIRCFTDIIDTWKCLDLLLLLFSPSDSILSYNISG